MLFKNKKEVTIPYQGKTIIVPIKYSRRKSLTIEVKPDMSVTVKAPTGVSFLFIKKFVLSRADWIASKLEEYEHTPKPLSFSFTEQQIQEYKKDARKQITSLVQHYADIMNVSYGRISIREQKTCWGSCSSKRNLNFNWKLVLMPQPIMEYVVVHELAHLFEMNHSKNFWSIVEKYIPDYKSRRKWLKEKGKHY